MSGEPRRLGVVFVHGFNSGPETWDTLRDLIAEDDGLAFAGTLAFEYTTGLVRLRPDRRIPTLSTVADSLKTYLEVRTPGSLRLMLVGHSMGGLVIQRYLVRMLNEGRGAELSRIRRVVLFATPNTGSEILRGMRQQLLGTNPQERELRVLDETVRDTHVRVVHDIARASRVTERTCPIPFSVFAGTDDQVVPRASAQGYFPDVGALPGDHFSIVKPRKGDRDHAAFATLRYLLEKTEDGADPPAAERAADERPLPAPAAPAPGAAPERHLKDGLYRSLCENYLRVAFQESRYIELGDLGMEQDADDPGDAGRARQLGLDEMYISLQADPRSLSDRRRAERLRLLDEADLAGDTARALSGRENTIEAILAGGPRSAAGTATRSGTDADTATDADTDTDTDADAESGVPLETAFERHRVLVVLGDPGSGKSVLCLWLENSLARRSRSVLSGAESGPLRVPMRFRAADYARYYARDFAEGEPPGGLPEFLAAHLPDGIRYSRRLMRDMFERALADGDAVLLIDGLDELTDYRKEVTDALVALVRTQVADRPADHPAGRAQAVITSRIAGYDDVYLTVEEAAHYLIRPMSEEQIARFAGNFFTAIGDPGHAPPFLDRVGRSNPTVRRFAANPLLLTSMCSYWHRHHELPPGRSELYRRLVLDTGYRWRRFTDGAGESAIDRLLGDEEAFLGMLSRVARRIHDRHADGRISEEELLETLDDALFGLRRVTGDDPRPVTLGLVDRIRQRVGILAEFSSREFGFIHPTFREYLAGRDLRVLPPPAGPGPDLFDRFRERLGDPRWREPLLLALGECSSKSRTDLIRRALDTGPEEREVWAGTLLAAAVDQPAAAAGPVELTALLELAARTREDLRDVPDALDALDHRLAALRRHLGAERFDFLTLSLFADSSLIPPLAALYWRRRWLTAPVLERFAEVALHDTPDWGRPVQRALRRAAAGEPRREAEVRGKLDRPENDDPFATRLYELGRAAWERQRQRADESVVEEPAPGTLPLRELFTERPELWQACLADPGSARVICALFGGLDHHDALHWAAQYEDFARMLQLPDMPRQMEVERRATELVPEFGAEDIVYNIAVLLDTVGKRVTRAGPRAAVEVRWLSRPSAPALRGAVHRWALRTPGEPAPLREALARIATAEEGDAAERAEAELGLLVLDGRPMTPGRASVTALEGALEATGDAMIRGSRAWLTTVWESPDIPDAERPALYRFLLTVCFLVAGRPVSLAKPDTRFEEPVLIADRLAGRALARSWGEDPPADSGLNGISARQLLAAVGWLTTLPYPETGAGEGDGAGAVLWHEDMPRAAAAVTGAPARALRTVSSWMHRRAPDLEPEVTAALVAAAEARWEEPPEAGAGELPALMAELYPLLTDGRGTVPAGQLAELERLAAQAPAGTATDAALLLLALSGQARDEETETAAAAVAEAKGDQDQEQGQGQEPGGQQDGGRRRRQLAALDLLAAEPDQALRAELLYRCRGHLTEDQRVRERFLQAVATLDSPVLRADAAGDLAGCAAALLDRLDRLDRNDADDADDADGGTAPAPVPAPVPARGAGIGPADRIALRTVSAILQELLRLHRGVPGDGEREFSPAVLADVPAVPEALADAARLTHGWHLPLDRGLLERLIRRPTARPEDAAAVAHWLSLVSGVEDEVVPELTAWAERAPADAPWAVAVRNLLVLHRASREPRAPGVFRELVELVCTADAGASARARLELLGPRQDADRDVRHHRLSEAGVDRWWALGRAVVAETDPARRSLYQAAVWEWDIDDADAVREAAGRAGREADGRRVWLSLLAPATIWRPGAQQALAEWLDAGAGAGTAPEADPEAARTVLDLLASLLTCGNGLEVGESLVRAVTGACVRAGVTARFVPDLPEGRFRLAVAGPVAEACVAASARTPDAGAPEPATDDDIAAARRLLRDRTRRLVEPGGGPPGREELTGYGRLLWKPGPSRPEDVTTYIPRELGGERAVLLLGWLRQLLAEDAHTRARALDFAVLEALLNILVVLSAREPAAYRLAARPEEAQPLLSQVVRDSGGLAGQAALILLGRLRFVDQTPAQGPDLVEVLDRALRGEAPTWAAAYDFVRTIRHVRGPSLAAAVRERIRDSPNEAVAQGFAGLAAAYARSPGCGAAERLEIRLLLRAESAPAGAGRFPLYLVGAGSRDDPFSLVLGPDRRSEFRRLLRDTGSPEPRPDM
ncbi:AAA family ATPase [Streptomyces aidingensis]|uniref:NACHT domain-containing protein n=1 Tax=Streptomyces aidingensis TaxID=910347 RepID=A0A1I1UED3_9ACTN|nr:AAA family ATPase [Streptomyces aidingensis]SFD69191.1 NACHT domain-containing protein [Streptomyces aidingensis]